MNTHKRVQYHTWKFDVLHDFVFPIQKPLITPIVCAVSYEIATCGQKNLRTNFLISFWCMTFDDPQEENMKLKKHKDQLGEPLCWSDYLSLPFTQNMAKNRN